MSKLRNSTLVRKSELLIMKMRRGVVPMLAVVVGCIVAAIAVVVIVVGVIGSNTSQLPVVTVDSGRTSG